MGRRRVGSSADQGGSHRLRGALAVAIALAVLLASCARGPAGEGVFHTVRRGENIFRIAAHYQVSVSSIMEANGIRDERSLQIGERLWIPEARHRPPRFPLPSSPQAREIAREYSRNDAIQEGNLSFAWPLIGRLTGRFVTSKRHLHQGIDIAAEAGTPIRASESGRVIYSGDGLGAYGRVVIIRHGERYSSVYAHNRENRVRKGAFVEKGEVIAEVGASGNATGPHLHFEIRRGERPCDPLDYLP